MNKEQKDKLLPNVEVSVAFEGEYVNSRTLSLVKDAGKFALKLRSQGLEAQEKSGKEDIVTKGDIVITERVKPQLLTLFPDIVFIDEETPSTHAQDVTQCAFYAVIDPIDGTSNYYQGYLDLQKPEHERKPGTEYWAISVGFVKDGDVVAGVIYQPERDKLFYAEKGRGAFLNGEKLEVSKTIALERSQPYFDFPYPKDKTEYEQTTMLQKALPTQLGTKEPVKLGSQVLEIAKIAEGEADFFFCLKTKPWDVAAGFSIVTEAGGSYTNAKGEPYPLFGENIAIKNNRIDLRPFYEMVKKVT